MNEYSKNPLKKKYGKWKNHIAAKYSFEAYNLNKKSNIENKNLKYKISD